MNALPLVFSGSTFPTLHDLLHSTGFVIARNLVVVFAVIFWLGLGFWAYRDARRRIGDPLLVFFATVLGLVPPYIGPVVYLLLRPAETLEDVRCRRAELRALEQHLARPKSTCPVCSSRVEPEYLACPVCTTMLHEPCRTCNAPLEPLWQICPFCMSPAGQAAEDLDAALRSEARTITLVDDSIPLVPQPEQQVGTPRSPRGRGPVSRALLRSQLRWIDYAQLPASV